MEHYELRERPLQGRPRATSPTAAPSTCCGPSASTSSATCTSASTCGARPTRSSSGCAPGARSIGDHDLTCCFRYAGLPIRGRRGEHAAVRERGAAARAAARGRRGAWLTLHTLAIDGGAPVRTRPLDFGKGAALLGDEEAEGARTRSSRRGRCSATRATTSRARSPTSSVPRARPARLSSTRSRSPTAPPRCGARSRRSASAAATRSIVPAFTFVATVNAVVTVRRGAGVR